MRVRKATSVVRHPVQELGTKVVADEPVVTGDREPGFGAGAAGPHRQRGEVEAGGPALGASDEAVDLARAGVHACAAEQRSRLLVGHGEVVGADLDDGAVRAESGRRQRHRVPGGDGKPGSGRKGQRQLGDHVDALGVGDRLGVVENQRHWLAHRRDRGCQQRDDRDRRAGEGQRSQHRGCDRLDPVQGRREVGQQNGRIIVAVVGRDPGDPRLPALGPLRQQCRLAVAGRRDNGDHSRCFDGVQPVDQRGPGHDPRPAGRPAQLRLQQRKAGLHSPRPVADGAVMAARGHSGRHSAATYPPLPSSTLDDDRKRQASHSLGS